MTTIDNPSLVGDLFTPPTPEGGRPPSLPAELVALLHQALPRASTVLSPAEAEELEAWLAEHGPEAFQDLMAWAGVQTLAGIVTGSSWTGLLREPHYLREAHRLPSRQIEEVHDHANRVLGVTRRLTPRRAAVLRARLREGFSVEDLQAVATWVSGNAFLRGDNSRGRAYDDYNTIYRSQDRVEQYLQEAQRVGQPDDDPDREPTYILT